MNLESICEQVRALTKEVGGFIQREKSNINNDNIEIKGLNDFVTYVDKTSEKKLVEKLLNILPEAGFITEEKTISKKENITTGSSTPWMAPPTLSILFPAIASV